MRKQHWAVINFSGENALVTLDDYDKGRFNWYGSLSWARFTDDTYIVKDYGHYTEGDDLIDAIEMDFLTHYSLVSEDKSQQSAGWLSPEGKFYPCGYFEHDHIAPALVAITYRLLDGVKELEERGWLRVYSTGDLANLIRDGKVCITQKQIDTMFDLSQLESGSTYAKAILNILDFLKYSIQ